MRYPSCPRLMVGLLLMCGQPGLVSAETPAPEGGTDGPLPALQLPPFPPFSDFNAILERPLFSPSRRPGADDDTLIGMATAEELKEQWQLTGIMLVGTEFKALLRQRNGDEHRILSVGMPLDDIWVLAEILNDGILLQAEDVQVLMQLHEPRDTEPRAAPSDDRTARGEGAEDTASQPDGPQPKEVSNE